MLHSEKLRLILLVHLYATPFWKQVVDKRKRGGCSSRQDVVLGPSDRPIPVAGAQRVEPADQRHRSRVSSHLA